MRKPRASPWECFAKKGPSCKGETHTVKFQAQVLGQKNPPFYGAPTGLAIVLRPRPRAMPWAFTWRPVGAGKAGFVARLLPVGAGKARFVARTLPVGLGRRGSFTASPRWGWEGVIRRAASPRWTRGPPPRWRFFQVHPQGNDLSPNGAPCESPGHRPGNVSRKKDQAL